MKSRFPKYTVSFPFGVVFLKTFTATTIFAETFVNQVKIHKERNLSQQKSEITHVISFFVQMKNTFINRFKISEEKFRVSFVKAFSSD